MRQSGTSMDTLTGALFDGIVVVADTLLLYRVYLIWKDVLWVCLFPAALHLSSIAILVAHVIKIERYLDVRAPQYHAIFIFLSVAFNTIVTASIVYRLLRASSALRKSLPGWKDSAYKGFVAILVESALPLAACGLARASMEVFDIRASRSMNLLVSTETWFRLTIFGVFVDKLYLIVAAISPQLIIFRVTAGRSWMTHEETTIPLSSPIAFAGGTSHLSTITIPSLSTDPKVEDSCSEYM
ncbi:hypothetical protein CC2G_001833 [Coprinopsis cinerea AmutBmut pab1-1]|nr:hypothetical protein CC2G_001833 [Coprinopsis cinerea AmutBmut pab1-1]